MRAGVLLLLFLVGGSASAETEVHGRWRFYKKIYQETEMPEPPSAPLRMFFEFRPDGESVLQWSREGDSGHCLRKGRYRVAGDRIEEKVTWVDPENAYGCSQDPDMQLGRETKTYYYFHGPGRDLALRFHLGEEPLDLVWKRESE